MPEEKEQEGEKQEVLEDIWSCVAEGEPVWDEDKAETFGGVAGEEVVGVQGQFSSEREGIYLEEGGIIHNSKVHEQKGEIEALIWYNIIVMNNNRYDKLNAAMHL